MKPGKKPKPTKLKLLHGEKNKDRINKNEPKPALLVAMRAPKFLDKAAKKEWKRLSFELGELGLLTNLDVAALAAYCQNFSRWAEAEKLIQEKGLLYKNPSGTITKSPLVNIADKAADQMYRFSIEFGLTPSSRSRIEVDKVSENDDFSDLLD